MPTPYDVNGKTPLSAWIPSLDTSGNGTTTLTDLVGPRNGTLTNMDPATGWVADTAAGGVRAIDFDGIGDLVACGNLNISGTTQFSFSVWLFLRGPGSSNLGRFFEFGSTNSYLISSPNTTLQLAASSTVVAEITQLPFNAWHHLMMSISVGSSALVWLNGVLQLAGTRNPGSGAFVQNANFIIGNRENANRSANCRLDDLRIFGQTLDNTDNAYLWNGGNGRGVILSGGSISKIVASHYAALGI